MIYLDNAATTYPKPEEVYCALDYANRNLAVNSGRGSYKRSRDAESIIAECRRGVADLVGACESSQVVFTASATIAINQILWGMDWSSPKCVYVSPYEHNAVMRPLHQICARYGQSFLQIPLSADGTIDEERLETMFAKNPPELVIMSHVSNVTGYILPVERIAKKAHAYGATVVVDGSQSVGVLDCRLDALDADFLVFAGHKTLYASFGIGGYIARKPMSISPVLAGGTGSDSLNLEMPQELPNRFEPASHDIVAIAGLNAALRWRAEGVGEIIEKTEKELTAYLAHRLQENPSVEVYTTKKIENHIGVISFNHMDYYADEIGQILDQDFDIAVRTGYHCAPLIHEVIGSKKKRGTVRASISYFTKKADIDALIEALEDLD